MLHLHRVGRRRDWYGDDGCRCWCCIDNNDGGGSGHGDDRGECARD
jgi:hypothetical protein